MLSTDISEETKNKWDKHRRVDLKYNILTREKDFFFLGWGDKKERNVRYFEITVKMSCDININDMQRHFVEHKASMENIKSCVAQL